MTEHRLDHAAMPAYLDKEISSEGQDKFGHTHIAAALRDLVEAETHRPPYSIGLLGKWGTGKSTVKRLYLDGLRNDEKVNDQGTKRRDRTTPITFNAWKYAGESEIRKSLLRHIFIQIGGAHNEADRNLFKTVSSTEYRNRTFRDMAAEFLDQYAIGLLIVVLFGLLFAILVALMAWVIGLDDPISSSVGLLSSAGIVALLAQKFFSHLTILSARTPLQVTSPPSQTIDEFEDLFLAQLAKFKRSRGGKNVRRIVVFIDDLDRLTADEMVSGLDGIRSLSEIASNKMDDEIGIVFVISCDEERVADALSKRRTTAELPAAVSSIQDARRYLDRIFQFRLEIPPFAKRDMRNFALVLLENEYPALKADLKTRNVDLQELVDRMIHPGVQSPRNAIQIVNQFAQSWWLGVVRERSAVGTNTPGGLGEGIVTKNPLTLGIICNIRTDFPDFYHALQRNPRIFDYFIDRFVRPEPLQILPSEVREQLSVFAADQVNGAEVDEQKRRDVKPQHRGLRQFMSHVQDVRRPYSLQPLLALSQDPVSRRHGDKAVPIEEALRTSDLVALLDAVGLSGSSGPFPPDIGALLADIIDDLRTETPTIQDNVAYTVAKLDQRVPEKDKRRVLGFAVRRAGDSNALRWRLGPSTLHRLVPCADPEESRALGRALIDDITADPANVCLPSLEQPSLREGCDLAQYAADLVVEIMQIADVPPQAQATFGQWLLSRTVKVAEQSTQIPLSWLEDKLAAHEPILLPLIRDEYPQVVAEELSRDQPGELDLSVVATRLDAVLSYLFQQGTQTRSRLWGHLKNFASLRQAPLVTLAFRKFSAWHDDADVAAANSIFAAMGRRLVHWEEESSGWPLDGEPALRDIFTSLAEAHKSFDADGIAHMAALARAWSQSAEQASSAAKLYDVLAIADPTTGTALGQEWAKRFFTDLPIACQRKIVHTLGLKGSHPELPTAIAATITALLGANPLSDHQIQAFSLLLSTLDPAILQSGPLSEQIDQFVEDTVNLTTQNPGDHLVSKARAFAGNLGKLPPGKAQQLLASFAQLRPHPSILAAVYNEMTNAWPVPATEGGLDYPAQDLFNAGIEVCSQLEQAVEAAQLLKSLDSLYLHARIHRVENRDSLVACAYDLWNHAPEESEALFRSYPDAERLPEQLVALVTAGATVEHAEGANSARTLAALVHEVDCAHEESVREATTSLLAQPAIGTDSFPDPILALWARAVAVNDAALLIDTILDGETNDEQAVRLYHHILDNLQHVSSAQFIALLKQTLPVPDGRDKTADAVVNSLPDVAAEKFGTDEKRRELCESVMVVFAEIPKRERKAAVAKACTPVGLKDVVVDGGYTDSMSADDLEIVEQFAGKLHS